MAAELDQQVRERTSRAQDRADAQVAAEHDKAEDESRKSRENESRKSQARLAAARAEAENAQEIAEGRYRHATELLAEAREHADAAARAADEAAERARAEAERITAAAQHDADEAGGAVVEAEDLRKQTAHTAAAITRSVRDDLPGNLSDLTKAELLDLAAGQGIAGRNGKTKAQLVDSLRRAAAKEGRS
ncbi:hypothetical protein [Nocardioides sp. Bht2]|uniref:hypothetical protein n=1 Tax=Nocardioides sp. Bht2 TaxID=3392297 RepID=UPI0039B53D40